MKITHLLLIAIALVDIGCQKGRDTFTPLRAFWGHWNNDRGADWYFDSYGGAALVLSTIGIERGSYRVMDQNSVEKKLRVQITVEGKYFFELDGSFSEGYKTFSGITAIFDPVTRRESKTRKFDWEYVDDFQEPPYFGGGDLGEPAL